MFLAGVIIFVDNVFLENTETGKAQIPLELQPNFLNLLLYSIINTMIP